MCAEKLRESRVRLAAKGGALVGNGAINDPVQKTSPCRPAASPQGCVYHVPIAVTWHAGTFYAAIEALEAAGVPFAEIKLVHASDRLEALLGGATEAAALMEPLVSRAAAAGARKLADLRWRGGIVAGDDVDEATAAKLRRALNRAIHWLPQNE